VVIRVRSDKPSFRTVEFKKGFNVILADRTRISSERDSRNGLGKTTLVEIINFCFGSSPQRRDVLKSEELKNWTFTVDLILNGKKISVSRNTSNPSKVYLEGDLPDCPIEPQLDEEKKAYFMRIEDWRKALGYLIFNLPLSIYEKRYTPTFRSLISYFMRKGTGAFNEPFKHYSQQKEWDIQVNNAYLLGLNWEYASQFQILKDQKNTLRGLRKAAKEGLLLGYVGTLGELEAEKVRLQGEIEKLRGQLKSFKIHPQYAEIEKEADELTREIHKITNELVIIKKILNNYQENLKIEKEVSLESIEKIYKEVGVWFSEKLKKRIEEVKKFHIQIVENRKTYLESEVNRLKSKIEHYQHKIEDLSDRRAKLLKILETHGALEEYRKLNERLINLQQQLEDILNRIDNLKKFETGLSELKIKREELFQKTRQDLEERGVIIEKAIRLFNQNSEFLYSEPGILSIDVTPNGYKFNVEIKRARSQGVSRMKVFCYDLMLIQLRDNEIDKPGFLIHDSTIFDGVDERQIARAMELAAKEALRLGFQYICLINSDKVPYNEFSEEFRRLFEESIRIRLTDDRPDGGLLGIRF